MKIKLLYSLLFVLSIISISCSQNSKKTDKVIENEEESSKIWVDSIYNSLSLDEKVGQLFNVAIYTNKGDAHFKEILDLIKKENIGGLIFMQDDAKKQIEYINTIQKEAKVPLLIGMDLEFGLAMRLKNTHQFPYAMTLGAVQDNNLIYAMANQIALDCKKIGVHWNFAPVVDVNTNPNNPIIGNRSFGSDRENIVEKSIAYMNGLQDNHILSSAKHFPGHGDTSSDSHKSLPVVAHNIERLQETELYPFKKLIENGVMGIMVAHLQVPALEKNEKIPSSLSKNIVTDLLKNELKFNGLIVTDALNMKGVTINFPDGETDLKAFEAGNDVLLFSQAVEKGKQKIIDAIKSKKIPESRLEESVKKILNAKYFAELYAIKKLETDSIYEELNSENHKKISEEIYNNAVTVVKNDSYLLPFSEKDNVVVVQIGESDNFIQELKKYNNITVINKTEYYKIKPDSKVLISVNKDTSTPYKSYKISNQDKVIIEKIAEKNPTSLVVFTSPYSLKDISINNLKSVVVAYENNEYTQSAVAKVLFGKMESKGKLPVDVNDEILAGMGIQILEESATKPKLNTAKIDTIIEQAIKRKETPSVQLLVAHKGDVLVNKSYGTETYESSNKIDSTYIYDLASLTKVFATTSLAMIALDESKINLNDNVKKYLTEYENHYIGTLTIRELLQHKTGLVSYIPFYRQFLERKNLFFYNIETQNFEVKVADNIFTRSDIYRLITKVIKKSEITNKQFEYSDLNMFLMMRILEESYSSNFESLFNEKVKSKLNLTNTFFNPNEKNKDLKIVPTVDDNYFRNQIVKGYVQDEFAGILGGVSGHAGLFSNTEDLFKLTSAFLNNGKYDDVQLFNPEILNLFTKEQYNSKYVSRGLGFDKQTNKIKEKTQKISDDSFGHYGYTGTMFWIDKKKDLIYIFLSNRTFPNASNNSLNKNRTRERVFAEVLKQI
ncbi:MAG: serine hydrolase [Flavobacteriales bacterium]|nr:serine hydrolase [Flavobacteriales bacterium]